mmetsp:Transcript_14055/g.16006  ORF Transcript_14055/g.16006 Transcript_14055/m.16006 type:complete len:138 (+) Transcript_14055:136-549(+)
MDCYEILGVPPEATGEEIRRKYHSKLKTLHPDKLPVEDRTPEKNEKFLKLQAAWEILRDCKKRQEYDLLVSADAATQIDLDDIPFCTESNTFQYKCRCGDVLKITIEQLEEGIEIYECFSCSLRIHLLYKDQNENLD